MLCSTRSIKMAFLFFKEISENDRNDEYAQHTFCTCLNNRITYSTLHQTTQRISMVEDTREQSDPNISLKPHHCPGYFQVLSEHADQESERKNAVDSNEALPAGDQTPSVPLKTLGFWPLTILVFYSVSGEEKRSLCP